MNRTDTTGIFLREKVKEGNETKNLVGAGAGIQLIRYLSRENNIIGEEVVEIEEPVKVIPIPPTITAAKKHLLKSATIKSKIFQSLGEKLNRRLSMNYVEKDKEPSIVPKLPPEEYLYGTPIFYKAVLALQSRHGGYLTFDNDLNINALNKTIKTSSEFVIMNASNLTDEGNVRYGNAVWIVFDNRRVLGSQYTGVGENRKLEPALIKCSKGHITKAHYIGRWIIMSRNDPIGKLGKPCLHGDKINLEQEWRFLSCPVPKEVNLYRTKRSTEDPMAQGYNPDFFEPIEDASWK